jgi:hypothetical protein
MVLSRRRSSGHRSAHQFAQLTRLLNLVWLAVAFAPLATAQSRHFPATYQIADVSEEDSQVQLTISLTVHNFSGADIRDARIVLYSSDPHADPIGEFDSIRMLPSYQDAAVRGRFTVPRAEFDQWRQGMKPRLSILIPNGSEDTRIESLDLHRDAVPANPVR